MKVQATPIGYAQCANSVGNNINFATTRYFTLNGGLDFKTTEADAQQTSRLIDDHDFSEMSFGCQSNTINGTSTATLRKNGADTALAASIGASTSGHFFDSSDTVVISDNDLINYSLVTGGSSGTASCRYFAVYYILSTLVNNVERALATETTSISEAAFTRLTAKTRARTDTAITIGENRARLAAKMRPIATQTIALSENVIRIKGKVKSLATETITVGGGTLARLLAKIRTRTGSETIVLTDNRTRLAAKNRALAAQTTTVGAGTIAEIKGAVKTISQTITIGENLARLSTEIRTLATQTTTIGVGTASQIIGKDSNYSTDNQSIRECYQNKGQAQIISN